MVYSYSYTHLYNTYMQNARWLAVININRVLGRIRCNNNNNNNNHYHNNNNNHNDNHKIIYYLILDWY